MNALTAKQQQLVVDHIDLVCEFIDKKNGELSEPDRQDVFQILCLGIIRAAKKWRKGRGRTFPAYARRSIYYAWQSWLRTSSREKAPIPLPPQRPTHPHIDAFFWDDMAYFTSSLSWQEKMVFDMVFHQDEFTQAQVAKVLKISQCRVSYLKKRAIQKLQRHFIGGE